MKKLFTNDKFFLATIWIALVGMVVADAMYLLNHADYCNGAIRDLLCVLCLLFIYTSYRKHSKNVMKGMMGALLMALVIQFISWMAGASGVITLYTVLNCLSTLFACLLFINHFIINSDHHSSPKHIRFNQILVLLFAILEVAKNVIYVFSETDIVFFIADILWAIAFVCMAAAIVCVESRLDAYRLDREAAGWTEEKGYPENYIHQKDR